METKLGKITRRRERIHYFQLVIMNSIELVLCLQFVRSDPFSCWRKRSICIECWDGEGWNAGEIGVTVMISMCKIVVMAAIVGV